MASIDLIEQLMHHPAGGSRVGAAVGCLMLAAAILGSAGADAAAGRSRGWSGRSVSERSRVGAGPAPAGSGERSPIGDVGVERSTALDRLVEGGAERVASPTRTPQRPRDARLDPRGSIHPTLFQELDTGGQP